MFEIKKVHIIGIVTALIVIVLDFFLFFSQKVNLFYFIVGISFVIGAMPFIVDLMVQGKKEQENNEMFLEFARNLVESVKSGTPISKSIIILKDKNFGSLTNNVKKLANQISLGIPVKEALEIFARDVHSKMVYRAVALISQAEKAGGEIQEILEAVAKSTGETEKLRKERSSAVYSIVVQGYIIFFIFIVIMLIMQFKILPMTSEISATGQGGASDLAGVGFGGSAAAPSQGDVSAPMLYLLLMQGFFTGLVIGKLADGNFKSGIRHSFIMLAMSILIYTGAKAFF